ncbi:MAG TPA: hypothetical protein VFU88_05430 [Ktedonobacterales bacterium]|nr:hypothetical protein [Ktedonobacterales bacterium]
MAEWYVPEGVERERERRGCWGVPVAVLLAGLLVGAGLTLLVQVLWVPGPAMPAAPRAAGDATLTVDDAFLSQLAAGGLAQGQLPFSVSNVRVRVQAGNVMTMTGTTSPAGLLPARELSVTGQLAASGGRVSFHVTQATVGGLPLPPPVDAALEQALNARLATLADILQVGNTHYSVTGVRTTDGQLTAVLAAQ